MTLQKNLIWTAMFSTAVGLTACGGGSSGSSSSNLVSGVVADGYLENATVCLDLNANKKCDANEPTAITAADGSYSFSATPAQVASAAIVAEIVAGETIDSDIGAAVARAYTLSAPVGKPEFVSPLTTMIQSKLELNPSMTPEQAEGSVKEDLGIVPTSNVNLYADFIEEGQAGDDDYKTLHQTAQVVARVMATFTETLKNQLGSLGVAIGDDDLKDIQKIVARTVISQLPVIYSSSKQRIEGGGDVDVNFADTKADDSDDSSLRAYTKQDYENSKQEFELLATSESITPVEALNSGGIVFMNYDAETEVGGVSSSNIVSVMAIIADHFYEAKVDIAGVLGLTEELGIAARLDAGDPADEIEKMPITKNADGSISFTPPNGSKLQVFSVSKMDLAGKTFELEDVVDDYKGAEDATVTFAAGDISYQFAYSETPQLHLGNLGNVSGFAGLCPTGESHCNIASPGELGDNTFSEFSGSATVRATVINNWYWQEEGVKFYISDTATETVAMCKYDTTSITTVPSVSNCTPNTEVVLGQIVSSQFANGTAYVAIPRAYDKDDGRLDIEYTVYLTDGTDTYRYDEEVELNGTPETGVFKPFNLSAMKRILDADANATP